MLTLLLAAMAKPPELNKPEPFQLSEETHPTLFIDACQPQKFSKIRVHQTETCTGYIIPLDIQFSLEHKIEVELPFWEQEAQRQNQLARAHWQESKDLRKARRGDAFRSVVYVAGAVIVAGGLGFVAGVVSR